MNDLIVQLFGLVILFIVVGGGYWRWVRTHGEGRAMRGLLFLILLTMAGGFIGSTGWWFDEPRAFSWDLPPLASRMLAVAGWAFGGASLMTLQRPSRTRTQLILIMLAVYLVPLAIAIVLFHLDRFNWQVPITYSFFVIVLVMVTLSIWYLIQPPTPLKNTARQLPPSLWRKWLTLTALITGIWGTALFMTDNGPSTLVWVWPGDLLTSRLIGVMLLTITTASIYSLRDEDAAYMTQTVIIIYGLGAALANLWSITAGKPIQPMYVLVLGGMGVISLLMVYRHKALNQYAV